MTSMRLGKLSPRALANSFLIFTPYLTRAYTTLSDASLKSLPDPTSDFNIHNGKLLAPILIPRVPGTPNSLKVLQHFTDFWTNELPDWKIEYDNSTATTPLSNGEKVPFVSMVFDGELYVRHADKLSYSAISWLPETRLARGLEKWGVLYLWPITIAKYILRVL